MKSTELDNLFDQTIAFTIVDNSPEVAKMVDNLANGEFVVVIENRAKHLKDSAESTGMAAGNSAFQIYGLNQGLTATEITNDKYAEATRGGWAVKMVEEATPQSALFLFKTDYETTKTAFDSLTAPTDAVP